MLNLLAPRGISGGAAPLAVRQAGQAGPDSRFDRPRRPKFQAVRRAQHRLSNLESGTLVADYQSGLYDGGLRRAYTVHGTTVSAHVPRTGMIRIRYRSADR